MTAFLASPFRQHRQGETDMIEIEAAEGRKFPAYRTAPTEDAKGTVILLGEGAQNAADAFAVSGYVAIVPTPQLVMAMTRSARRWPTFRLVSIMPRVTVRLPLSVMDRAAILLIALVTMLKG